MGQLSYGVKCHKNFCLCNHLASIILTKMLGFRSMWFCQFAQKGVNVDLKCPGFFARG